MRGLHGHGEPSGEPGEQPAQQPQQPAANRPQEQSIESGQQVETHERGQRPRHSQGQEAHEPADQQRLPAHQPEEQQRSQGPGQAEQPGLAFVTEFDLQGGEPTGVATATISPEVFHRTLWHGHLDRQAQATAAFCGAVGRDRSCTARLRWSLVVGDPVVWGSIGFGEGSRTGRFSDRRGLTSEPGSVAASWLSGSRNLGQTPGGGSSRGLPARGSGIHFHTIVGWFKIHLLILAKTRGCGSGIGLFRFVSCRLRLKLLEGILRCGGGGEVGIGGGGRGRSGGGGRLRHHLRVRPARSRPGLRHGARIRPGGSCEITSRLWCATHPSQREHPAHHRDEEQHYGQGHPHRGRHSPRPERPHSDSLNKPDHQHQHTQPEEPGHGRHVETHPQ